MTNFMNSKLEILSFILLIATPVFVTRASNYVWSGTDEWTPCSMQCGEGEEQQVFECLKNTIYKTQELEPVKKCSNIKKPINERNCTFGNCPTNLTGSFIWVVGNWSQCPKTCGSLAIQNREVSCFLKTNNGQLLVSKLSKCDSKIEPKRFLPCAKTDCPPKFLSSKWGKCPEAINCGTSVRRRIVKCVSLLRDGKHKVISSSFCYRIKVRPLRQWMTCTPDNGKKCEKTGDLEKYIKSDVKIEKDNAQVFQMRSSKSLRLTVGQTAFILTFTKITVLCPVVNFPHSLLKWSHDGMTYEYKGESNKRIRVNRRGILVIREFLLNDTGIWKCHAGRSSANISLHHELPSNGFHNWLKRHSNHNYGMFNEESKGAFIVPDSLTWMKSDWSKCSLSCGSDEEVVGFQVRKVTCEKVEAKYYKVIDEKYCPTNKPISQRKCTSTLSCPHWRVEREINEKCTDQCINIDLAKMNTNIYCEYETRTVDSSFCDNIKRPNSTCSNTKCKLSYQYSPWSQCSLSCSNTTNVSIRSRTMHCVWDHGGNSAYNLCQHYNLSHKPLTKPCKVPKCILGCRDLTPTCQKQSKYRCRSSIFYHFCCAFCHIRNRY